MEISYARLTEIFVVSHFHHMHLHVGTFVIFYMVFFR